MGQYPLRRQNLPNRASFRGHRLPSHFAHVGFCESNGLSLCSRQYYIIALSRKSRANERIACLRRSSARGRQAFIQGYRDETASAHIAEFVGGDFLNRTVLCREHEGKTLARFDFFRHRQNGGNRFALLKR